MEELCRKLREIFSEDNINTEVVRDALSAYKSDPADWRKFAKFDAYKYTRNLVDEGNGKYNLMVLCWKPGVASSIHDHTGAHCFVKVLEGELRETRFAWPTPDNKDAPLVESDRCAYKLNEVTYMSDQLGLHRMENPSKSDACTSLHLYIPPFKHCHVFDQRTGRKTTALVTFYTKNGQKMDYKGSKEGDC